MPRPWHHLAYSFCRKVKSCKANVILVNAEPNAIGFYQKLGWQAYNWDTTELQGIASDCVQMRLIIE